ncbi:tetratricopeptide repeat protein [Myxococcota bacterium]|nr:tetratricopeptide repeat protein [Myxococcota bacterium]
MNPVAAPFPSRRGLQTLLLVLAVGAAWGIALRDDFAWDDTYLVRDNADIRSIDSVPGFFLRPWASGTDYDLGARQNATYFRPLALATMAVDHALFGGTAWGFHLGNVLVHLAAALVLLSLGQRWGVLLGLSPWIPWIVSLVWAVHPVHAEAVHLVSYRTTLLSTLAVLGMLRLSVPLDRRESPAPRIRRTFALVACWSLGLLSKETAAVGLPLLVLQDLFLGRLDLRRIAEVHLPLMAVLGLWWWYRDQVTTPGIYSWFEGLTPVQSALMVPRVLFLYVRLVLIPWPLCPFYDWSVLGVPRSPWEPDILAGLLLLVLLPVAATWTFRRAREVSLGLSFFLVALAPVSHVVPFFDAAGERFLHLPLAGILWALVSAGFRVRGPSPRRLLAAILAVSVLGGVSLSFRRGLDWRDSETVLRASVRDFPDSVSAWLGLGRLYLSGDRAAEAVPAFRQARTLAPSLPVVHGLLAVSEALSGDLQGARRTLIVAPPPPQGLPSAAEIARQEVVRSGRTDLLAPMGL